MTRRSDGGLRGLFHKHLPDGQWTAIETGATAGGVPDSEFCFDGGIQGWIEFKTVSGSRVKMRPTQVGWLLRRTRLGGRCFVAAMRRKNDERTLYVWKGLDVIWLASKTISEVPPLGSWAARNAADWPWEEVGRILRGGPKY